MSLDTSVNAIPLDRWVHLAYAYDPAGPTLAGYINGVQEFSLALGGGFTFGANAYSGAFIGAGHTGVGDTLYNFFGSIDEVRLSSRVVPPNEFNLRLSPPGLAAQAQSNSVTLSWSAPGGQTPLRVYRIYKGTDPNNLSVVDSVMTPGYSDGNVVAGATYYYRVTAVDQLEFESVPSIQVSASPLPLPAVTSTVPNRNATNASPTVNPKITFNTPLLPDSVTTGAFVVYTDLRGTISLDSVTYDATNIAVTLYPGANFLPGEKISILMKRKIVNTNGDLIAKPNVLSFVTATSNGNGVFSLTSSVSNGAGLLADLVMADLDNDGDLDAATVSQSPPEFLLFENDGTGGFTRRPWAAGTSPTLIRAADFDGDGDVDIAIADNAGGGADAILLYQNNGGWNFTLAATKSLTAPTDHMAVGDWDGDGDPDIGIVSAAGSYAGFIINNLPTNLGLTTYGVVNLFGAEFFDIESDGDLDLLFLNASGVLNALRSDGFGNFSGVLNFGGPFENGATNFATGDLNGDGNADVVVSEPVASQVAIIQNNGGLSYSRPPGYSVSHIPGHLAVGDIDGDGDLDIVATATSTDSVIVVRNNGSLTLSQQSSAYTSGVPIKPQLADVDSDGDSNGTTITVNQPS